MAEFCSECSTGPNNIDGKDAHDNESDGEEVLAPIDRIVIPSDVVTINDDEEFVYIVGTRNGKVTRISGLDNMINIKELTLRSCLISSMEGVENLFTLTKLELYDNHIQKISSLENLTNLTILDLSFNSIRDISPVSACPLLQELYAAQNKLRKIEGLTGLQHLRTLDLGANRIRVMEGIDTLTSLRSLWLGKNKIEKIENIQNLSQLTQLDVQNNRLTSITGLGGLASLEELYLACNAINDPSGLLDLVTAAAAVADNAGITPPSPPLHTLDLTSNGVSTLNGIISLPALQELWMSYSKFTTFEELLPLTTLPELSCIYLEHSPIAADFEYRIRITQMLPSLTQLDAILIPPRKR